MLGRPGWSQISGPRGHRFLRSGLTTLPLPVESINPQGVTLNQLDRKPLWINTSLPSF